jgi:hypothetical protein
VVEDASERVGRVLTPRRVLDRLRDGDAEAARRARVVLEDRPARLRVLRWARDDARAPGLHHRAPVGLLVVGDLDHVDLALEAKEPAGERQGASPLPRPGLGREALTALLLRVVGLRDGRVRLVTPGRADALVLVEDTGLRAERSLETVRAEQRRRPPELEDLAHRLRYGNLGRFGDLLEDQLHREQRRKVVRPDRLACPRVEDRLWPVRHVSLQVVPALRQRRLWQQHLRPAHRGRG